MNYSRSVHEFLEKVSSKPKNLVFTNGCFDILHVGHIRYIQKSNQLGQCLVIGLNSDISVKKIKGKSRPINNENDRAEVLLALSCVDHVILFDEDTPFELIKMLKPDILTKGGDYTKQDIVGYDIVTSYGGKVIVLPFEKGYSSTKIINKL
ncbi:bifunctional heptose 7-phosphate kinase/heptose 1-phosphate adenyltransferase [bacterium B13(2017)]|nr:bifunctional heptose 7-phosphate kinase/heptose 1-phosphate adenyltransferase [bacterium B13(2017)]